MTGQRDLGPEDGVWSKLKDELNDKLAEADDAGLPPAAVIKPDGKGYFDHICPKDNCRQFFKIHKDNMGEGNLAVGKIYCPSCRHRDFRFHWLTESQKAGIASGLMHTLSTQLVAALKDSEFVRPAKRKNWRNVVPLFLFRRGKVEDVPIPIPASSPLRLYLICESCGCRYSYVGAAFFCPCCGHNSARHTFFQTLDAIRSVRSFQFLVKKNLDEDVFIPTMRAILEKALQDTVTSFQRLNEQLYAETTGLAARRNAFQNLDAGSKLWESALGIKFEDLLSSGELSSLKRYFQIGTYCLINRASSMMIL